MIWLVWRQHRKQLLFTALGLLALAAVMIPTGLAMRNSYADAGLADCIRTLKTTGPDDPAGQACHQALNQFADQYNSWQTIGVLFLALPLLIGLFWGAPLVAREVEQGTHRLIWTQGISRRRWAVTKIGFVAAATILMAVVYGLGMSWWISPLTQAGRESRFQNAFFDMQGVVPIGYTLFAVALGIFAGTRWTKVLPAMAVTIVGFIGVRALVAPLARPRYLPAKVRTYSVRSMVRDSGLFDGDWVQDRAIRTADGKILQRHAEALCPPDADRCPSDLIAGAYNWVQYQPANRFWLFQTFETGIFVALAVLLLGLALRRVRRLA